MKRWLLAFLLAFVLAWLLAVAIGADSEAECAPGEVCWEVTVCATMTPPPSVIPSQTLTRTPDLVPTPTAHGTEVTPRPTILPTAVPTRPVYCPILVGARWLGNEPASSWERVPAAGIELADVRVQQEPGKNVDAWANGEISKAEAAGLVASLATYGTCYPGSSAQYAQEVAHLARTFGPRLIAMRADNEPDQCAQGPEFFAYRQAAVYTAVREATSGVDPLAGTRSEITDARQRVANTPALIVSAPGLTFETTAQYWWADRYFRALSGYQCPGTRNGECLDAAAVHLYHAGGWASDASKLQEFRKLVHKYLPSSVPIWVTEFGDNSPQQHAVLGNMLDVLEAEDIPLAIIYRADQSGDPWDQRGFGLTDASLAMLAGRLLGR